MTAPSPRIAIVAAAGPLIGGGHVMRCLTLARALEARGATCAFVDSAEVSAVLDAFAPDIGRTPGPQAADALIFDNYALSAADHRRMAGDRPTLVIDDLADRPLGADLVLDAGPARTSLDYAGLVPAQCVLLLGPANAAVRPDFAALRERTLARRAQGGAVRRILVSLGLTDLGAISERVVRRLLPLCRGVAIDVVLGSEAPSHPGLSALTTRHPALTLHVDTPHMASLTAAADLAVGAGGSSAWERCTLGLPSLLVVLADNQLPAASALAERGAAIVLDARSEAFDASFDAAAGLTMSDAGLRARLSKASAAICDGIGAGRTADAYLRLIATHRRQPPAGS